MNDNGEMLRQLESMIPRSLDDIIRKNRDMCALRLATGDEIAGLPVPEQLIPGRSGQIMDWRFITCVTERGQWMIVLGWMKGDPYITSKITGHDPDLHYVTTRSRSIYHLHGEPGEGQPPVEQLMFYCAYLNRLGVGPLLGVPPFFT